MLVLILGDFHIPHRAADIPPKFKKMLARAREDRKIEHVLCTGNLCNSDMYDYLKSLCSSVKVVMGDFDERPAGRTCNEFEVVEIGGFKIGLIHGHQVVPWGDTEALLMWQRKLDCDILVSGGTHKFKAEEVNGRFLINPGSITGACSPTDPDPTPSFVLMDISGGSAQNFVYQMKGDEMKIVKREFTKKD